MTWRLLMVGANLAAAAVAAVSLSPPDAARAEEVVTLCVRPNGTPAKFITGNQRCPRRHKTMSLRALSSTEEYVTGRDDVGPPWVVALGTYGDAIIRLGADYNFCDLDLAFLSEAIDLATGQEVSFVQLVNLNPDHFPMRLRLADRDYAFVLADGGTLRVADARLAWADDADFTCEASAIVEYIDGPG